MWLFLSLVSLVRSQSTGSVLLQTHLSVGNSKIMFRQYLLLEPARVEAGLARAFGVCRSVRVVLTTPFFLL